MNLEYFRLAVEFIESSKKADSLDDLGRAFLATARELGFNHYACVSCVQFGDGSEDTVFLADYPDDRADLYLENGSGHMERILQVSLRNHLPFSWGSDLITKGLTEEEMEIFAERQEDGRLYGMTVPIHVVGAFPAAVNVVSDSREIDPAAEHAIHLMSVYLHDAAIRLQSREGSNSRPAAKLTARETECLEWVAAGKTDWEIASILSIAERTVHNHVESAKVKLGVHTRVQAVVKAFLANLIHCR